MCICLIDMPIFYYLGNNIDLLYISSKALPIVNKMYDDTIPTGPPRCPLPPIPSISDENQRLDSAVDLATLHDKGLPSLPSLPSRRKKKNKPLPPTPRPPPPPKITTNTPIQMKPQPSSAASKDAAYGVPILHVEKVNTFFFLVFIYSHN
jgi:hypothetical protein